MKIKPIHPNFRIPEKSSEYAAGFDIFMPTAGSLWGKGQPRKVGLGFAAEIPEGYAALILPRSSTGAKYGLELVNTCGLIDSDYRGEWFVRMQLNQEGNLVWYPHDRLLQFIIIPVPDIKLILVDELETTKRDKGGFGSTGK